MESEDIKRLDFLLSDHLEFRWNSAMNDYGHGWTLQIIGSQSFRLFSGNTKRECIDKAITTTGWWNKENYNGIRNKSDRTTRLNRSFSKLKGRILIQSKDLL